MTTQDSLERKKPIEPVLDGIDLSDENDQQVPEPIITKKVPTDDLSQPKKSRRRLYTVLICCALLSFIAGFMVWLFMCKGIYAFQGLPLSSFSNSYYSLKIPKGYSRYENNLGGSGTDITFFDKQEGPKSVQSKVYVVSGEMSLDKKIQYFKSLDRQYSEQAIEKSRKPSGLNGQANITYSNKDHKGLSSRTVFYEMAKGNDRVGNYAKLTVYKKDSIYEIIISSPRSNPGLAVDARKIIDSFDIH